MTKGNSEMAEYLAVDLEMTGLRVTRDRIIEIGAVVVDNGEIRKKFSSCVNPHRQLSDRIVELTGLTDEQLAEAPDISEVMPKFLEFAGERPLIGHNLMFDFSFLKQNAMNLGYSFERRGIDTLKLARKFLPQEQKKSLGALKQYYGLHFEHSHRAYDDARGAAEIYLHLEKDFQQQDPDSFEPKPLCYALKKQSPITAPQKRDLIHLLEYHKINPNVEIAYLTRSEASRMIDQINAKYGRLPWKGTDQRKEDQEKDSGKVEEQE